MQFHLLCSGESVVAKQAVFPRRGKGEEGGEGGGEGGGRRGPSSLLAELHRSGHFVIAIDEGCSIYCNWYYMGTEKD